MIFDIEQIYDEGLGFDMLVPKEHFNLDSVDIILTEDVKAQGKLEKSGHTIFVPWQFTNETALLPVLDVCRFSVLL